MADKHGPIFRLNIGLKKAVVVSSWDMAKECYVSNDKNITNRPKLVVVDIMAYGSASVFLAPYGSYWRSVRKILSPELLSINRIDMYSHVWKEETSICVGKLYGLCFQNKGELGVDLKQWFSQLSMSIILRIISGKNYVGADEEIMHLQRTLKELFDRLGSFFIGDALPFLRWVDFGGQEKAMRKSAREVDDIFESWLQQHKKNRSLGTSEESCKDFMDVMISVLEDSDEFKDSVFDADTIIKATCLIILVGASDTGAVFLTWAMSLLLNNRHTLKRAQDELNNHVGKDRIVS